MPIFDRTMRRFEWYFGIVEGMEDNTIGIYENTVLTVFSNSGVGLLANYTQFLEVQLFQKFCIFVCKNVQFNVNGAHPSLLGS